MSDVIREIALRFLEPLALTVAERAAAEYNDHQRRIISIGIHFQSCCIISDEYKTEDGKEDKYVMIEGMARQSAVSLQNSLCDAHGILPLEHLSDLFDRDRKRFLEIGITKRENDSYFQEKMQKIGNSMDIAIFTYGGAFFTNNETCLEETQKNRVFTFLSLAQDILRQEKMFTDVYILEGQEPEMTMTKSKTFEELRDESVPSPFRSYHEMRAYCESYKANKPKCQRMVQEMASEIDMKFQYLEKMKLRHLNIPDEKECPYTAKFLMKDSWFFMKPSDSTRSQPNLILKDFFNIANMNAMRIGQTPVRGKLGLMYSGLWSQIKRAIREGKQELAASEQRDFLTGSGKARKKIPERMLNEVLKEEDLRQLPTEGPKPRGFPKWFNDEWCWAMRDAGTTAEDLRNWIPMAEYPPASNEMEDYAKEMCESLESKIQSTNCAREMGKFIMTVSSLHTECNNFPGKVKILPIYARCEHKGERQDCLFGICVKGKSHLNKDDGMYTIVTFEFSIKEPSETKHEKYTVFKAGTIPIEKTVLTPKRQTILVETDLFLYCRTTGLSKIKNDWISKCRRCLISTMETVEQLVLKECALKEENKVKEMMNEKHVWIGHEVNENGLPDTEKLVRTKLSDLCRTLLVMQFYYCIYDDNQLEGFCNEQKKFLMFWQADKGNKSAFTFNQDGLYEKIEECIVNNPMCLFLANRLNLLFETAKLQGSKYFQ
uniref:Polymerase protein 3 n=1 Tax=Cane toad influenza-like virus TaxID=2777031 RepID=A0A866VZV8_9ORTO|nr:polymerase protein 3 [Cane toad influenza-like virus]